jgi:hypothetical protein
MMGIALFYGSASVPADVNKQMDTQVKAEASVVKKSIQNTAEEKARIQTLTLNSIDHFYNGQRIF